MGEVIRFKKPSAGQLVQGKTLCLRGFHKWTVATDSRFDSKQGRLVTLYRCSRCGATKTAAH